MSETGPTTQTAETLTPYLTRALEMLKEAEIEATGVTSPWDFGTKVEPAYQRAIIAAMKAVYGKDRTWYFLHMQGPEGAPELVVSEPPTQLVASPAPRTTSCGRPSTRRATTGSTCSRSPTSSSRPDGQAGAIRDSLAAGGWPIVVTHWQSLFSNGLETGLAVLDEMGRRVQESPRPACVWCSASEAMERTIVGES